MTDPDYVLTNRERAMAPKQGKSWCGCDRYYGPVHTGKCPVCGAKEKSRLKKDTSAR